jgi:hypothetical protein
MTTSARARVTTPVRTPATTITVAAARPRLVTRVVLPDRPAMGAAPSPLARRALAASDGGSYCTPMRRKPRHGVIRGKTASG